MSPKWGHRLVAFIPPLAFAVVPPLVLPRLCDSVSPSPPRHPSQWRYGIPSASSRRLPLSPFLGFVIRPIGLTVPIRLIPPYTLPYPHLSAILSSPISYLILTYSGLILHLWILILRATHRSQQGVVTPGRVSTQLVAVCRASPAGRCRATFRRLPSALLLDLLVLLSLLDLSPPISYLILTYLGLILHLWILILRATHHLQQGVVTPSRVPPS